MSIETIESIKDLQLLHRTYLDLEMRREELLKPVKGIDEHLKSIESKMLAFMKDNNLKEFPGEHGKLSITTRTSFVLPQEEDADKFREYCESKGIKDMVFTLGSQKFNSFMKAEMEAALEAGNVDWLPPGCKEPTLYETLNVRSKRK